jgi:hypothetical protein
VCGAYAAAWFRRGSDVPGRSLRTMGELWALDAVRMPMDSGRLQGEQLLVYMSLDKAIVYVVVVVVEASGGRQLFDERLGTASNRGWKLLLLKLPDKHASVSLETMPESCDALADLCCLLLLIWLRILVSRTWNGGRMEQTVYQPPAG